ncbi:hypothetical protein Poli38472_008445 [Pythium oligandrum]|uniref:Uncharacterized protein n=1 Tax=Pythium oligandrum TaxID=41045 RepID=A0A8K1C456_PYTOL|nr:hypothetical protein Poli38472_008445 [Pythium oligandrum]|eukprot:TMW55797.1 hypothetical protein Poli38472_008445 [Pythium oligandrum]
MTQQRRVSLGLIFVGLLFICVGRVAMVGPHLMALNQPNHTNGLRAQFASMNALQLDRYSREQARIPWLIHQSWKSVDKIPARFEPWMRSWRELNPQWQYIFWTDDDNLAIFEHVYPQYLYIAKALSKIALADMARYALLHHFGGLYADADFECVQPFGGLHEEYELFLSSEPRAHAVLLEGSDSPALCNALMASAPGHPFWVQVLESIKAKFDTESESDPVSLTGPRIVKSTYYGGFGNDTRVAVLLPTYFYPEVTYWNLDKLHASCNSRNDTAVHTCNELELCDSTQNHLNLKNRVLEV